MKNILLLVHDDEGQEARLQAALDLTRALEGHLSCIAVTEPPVVVGDFYGTAGMATAAVVAEDQEREEKNKAELGERLAKEDVSWSWVDVSAGISQGVLEAATLADLIVLNRQLDTENYPDMHDITSYILVYGRTPVVAVPEKYLKFQTGRAFIAWDGSNSCAATMRASVPLLKLADEVRIFTVNEKNGTADPDAAAEYLSRHGIHASIELVDKGTQGPQQLITAASEAFKADYILMGAYGRGRLRETFGGVTKTMLSTSRIPLLLGH